MRVSCVLAASLAGCVLVPTYVLPTAPGPAARLPAELYGAGPGRAATMGDLVRRGWTPAETRGDTTLLVLATAEPPVREAEALVRGGVEAHVVWVRLRYSGGRLATYRQLVSEMTASYGPPQESRIEPSFELFAIEEGAEAAPRPSRFAVHRWKGEKADLVLVAGLESEENLASAMDYQLLLVPSGM